MDAGTWAGYGAASWRTARRATSCRTRRPADDDAAQLVAAVECIVAPVYVAALREDIAAYRDELAALEAVSSAWDAYTAALEAGSDGDDLEQLADDLEAAQLALELRGIEVEGSAD